jgi:GNAT superfamily N-acetyltransferase
VAGAYTMTVEEHPTQEDIETVRWGLSNYNRQHTGDDSFTPLNLFVRDAAGAVAGGLLGGTYWSWLYVDTLWLSEPLRRHGWGSQLLRRAEQIAVERGCIGVHLDTTSFQARGFYEKQGYSVWGILDDLPPGHQRIFLRKRLSMAPA